MIENDLNPGDDILHLSLVIDNDKRTHIEFHLDDNLDVIVGEVGKKYNLDERLNKKLLKMIKSFVEKTKEKKREKLKKEEKIHQTIDRLYYKEKENLKIKDSLKKRILEEENKLFLDSCSFSPKVNFYPKTLFERKYERIEDKLTRDRDRSKEKIFIQRLKNHLDQRTDKKKKKLLFGHPNKEKSNENEILFNQAKKNFFCGSEKKGKQDELFDQLSQNLDRRPTANFKTIPTIELDNIALQKQPSNENNITPRNNGRRMTLMSNKSKMTYKSLYMQLKEDKFGKQHSIRSINESFESSEDESNNIVPVPRKENNHLTIPRQSKIFNSNSLQNKDPYVKRDSLFVPQTKEGHNRQIGLLNTHFKESFLNINLRRPSAKELSFITSDMKKKSTKTIKQVPFLNLTAETAATLTIPSREIVSPLRTISKTKSSKRVETGLKKKSKFAQEKEEKRQEKIRSCKQRLIFLKKQAQSSTSKDKNISKLFLNSKAEKVNSKSTFEYLYNNAETHKINKELFAEEILKNNYTFSPNAKKNRINMSKEEKDALVNRLVNSKKLHSFNKPNCSKSGFNTENSADALSNHTPVNSSSAHIKLGGGRQSQMKTLTKECTTENSTYVQSYEDHISNNSSRKYLNTSNFEKNLKDRFEKSFEKHKSIENVFSKDFANKSQEIIYKFTLNNLKEIFEIIFNTCDSIEDIFQLSVPEVSDKVKQKLVIPCVTIMKQRGLDFNFQNFFLSANEVLKTVL